MRSSHIPSILSPTNGQSPISTERALKNIIYQLKNYSRLAPENDLDTQDGIQVAIDDATTMLECINRGEE